MPALAIRPPRRPVQPSEWSDSLLLESLLENQEQAWVELVRRYRPLIYRCITKVTGKYAPTLSNADLDEIYAEVLISLLRDNCRKLRMYNPERGTKLGSWIGMISVNATYDFLRSAGRRPMLDRIDGALNPHEECDRTPLDILIEKERWTHLNGVLEEFSEKDRTFLHLYYAKGLDAASVADRMAISLKTVYSKKHKIRTHLRRCVERMQSDSAIADLVPAQAA
jgi:RNA polymerase sigma-70 factor (ECF subfamily)